VADAGDLDEARYKLLDAQNALEDVMLNDGQKLVNALRAELVTLIRLMDSKDIYNTKGRAYALAAEVSHGRQRYAVRGHDDDDVRLFSTPPTRSPPSPTISSSASGTLSRRFRLCRRSSSPKPSYKAHTSFPPFDFPHVFQISPP